MMHNIFNLDDYRPSMPVDQMIGQMIVPPLDVFMATFPDSEAAAEIRRMRENANPR